MPLTSSRSPHDPTRSRAWRASLSLVVATLLTSSSAARAQSAPFGPDARSSDAQLNEQVAVALYDRGMQLFEQGDIANAKKMFIETLERSGTGSRAADALRMLRQCNEKLGISDLDSGRPAPALDGPVDPYADPQSGGDTPLDPYADPSGGGTSEGPLDPYGDPSGGVGYQPSLSDPIDDDDESPYLGRRSYLIWGGSQGFITGMALVGPLDDTDQASGGAVLAGLLGAGAGVGLAYWADGRKDFSEGQYAAISSAGAWTALNFGILADVFSGDGEFTGDRTDGNTIWRMMAAGGIVGTGLGYWYGNEFSPSAGEMAVANSLGFYGAASGLMLGVGIDAPEGEAYRLNMMIGNLAGIAAGLYFKDELRMSRGRSLRIDLGATAGFLAPWVLLYPVMADETTNNDTQVAGYLSSLGVFGGALLAYYLTDEDEEVLGTEVTPPPVSSSLLRRSEGGEWSGGAPVPRPMDMPELAPERGQSYGIDLLSGRF